MVRLLGFLVLFMMMLLLFRRRILGYRVRLRGIIVFYFRNVEYMIRTRFVLSIWILIFGGLFINMINIYIYGIIIRIIRIKKIVGVFLRVEKEVRRG